jgi:hypothetical protein
MPILRKFTPIEKDDKKKHKLAIPKLSLTLGAGGVAGTASGLFIAFVVLAIVFLAVWIAGLVRMRKSCEEGVPPSIFWILTLVLGLIPTGATQMAALIMAIVGLVRPAIGCSRRQP